MRNDKRPNRRPIDPCKKPRPPKPPPTPTRDESLASIASTLKEGQGMTPKEAWLVNGYLDFVLTGMKKIGRE